MSIPVFSVHGFINWAERQDPKTTYAYLNTGHCLGAQYCHAHGLGYGLKEGMPIPTVCRNGSFREKLEYIASKQPHTYGAALARAKEMATP